MYVSAAFWLALSFGLLNSDYAVADIDDQTCTEILLHNMNITVVACMIGKNILEIQPLFLVHPDPDLYYNEFVDEYIVTHRVQLTSRDIQQELSNISSYSYFTVAFKDIVSVKFIPSSKCKRFSSTVSICEKWTQIKAGNATTNSDVFVDLKLFTDVSEKVGKLTNMTKNMSYVNQVLAEFTTCKNCNNTIKTNLTLHKDAESMRPYHEVHTFTNSSTGRYGIVQNFTVPFKGCFSIKAYGAMGGKYSYGKYPGGGRGAMKEGLFQLDKLVGQKLRIVVGQAGGDTQVDNIVDAGGGGGGGSFVYTDDSRLLLAAGGGGGAFHFYGGMPGQEDENGTASFHDTPNIRALYSGRGGFEGSAGFLCPNETTGFSGGVGAGWKSSGLKSDSLLSGGPGLSRTDGWLGGSPVVRAEHGVSSAPGGFGGGGAAAPNIIIIKRERGQAPKWKRGNGGGGGGYSGGGSGNFYNSGGGGGSYADPSAVQVRGVIGGNVQKNGLVTIKYWRTLC